MMQLSATLWVSHSSGDRLRALQPSYRLRNSPGGVALSDWLWLKTPQTSGYEASIDPCRCLIDDTIAPGARAPGHELCSFLSSLSLPGCVSLILSYDWHVICMCYQVLELYSACRCLYYQHAVDRCPKYGSRGHGIKQRTILVGYACMDHSTHSNASENSFVDSYYERALNTS